MSYVVFDTDVASASFRGQLPDRLRTRLTGETACISFVTLGELAMRTTVSSWGPRRRASLEAWREQVVVLPFSEDVALASLCEPRSKVRLRPSGQPPPATGFGFFE